MAMDYVPGVGMVDRATGKPMFSAPGEGPTAHEAQTDRYLADKKAFEDETHWRYDRDYDWGSLYGSTKQGTNIPSFSRGPNSSWGAALSDRLDSRRRGMLDGMGHFEGRLGTAEEGYQRRLYARNNAIEDMYRQGYSTDQIEAYMAGEVDRNDFAPDWKDYNKARREFRTEQGYNAMDAARAAMRGEEYTYGNGKEFWGDSYFKDAPDGMMSGGDTSSNPMLPTQPDPLPPTDSGDDGITPPSTKRSGGFLEAYEKRKMEIALRDKTSVKSLFKDMIEHE